MKYMLDEGAFAPEYAHDTDAGMDLRTPKTVIVPAHSSAIIDTGVHIQIPNNYVGFLKSKSGLNVKHGILSEGVIDCGYTGSIVVKLYNHSNTDYVFRKGNKITQLVILPCATGALLEQVESFDETERGDNGFGSTGK